MSGKDTGDTSSAIDTVQETSAFKITSPNESLPLNPSESATDNDQKSMPKPNEETKKPTPKPPPLGFKEKAVHKWNNSKSTEKGIFFAVIALIAIIILIIVLLPFTDSFQVQPKGSNILPSLTKKKPFTGDTLAKSGPTAVQQFMRNGELHSSKSASIDPSSNEQKVKMQTAAEKARLQAQSANPDSAWKKYDKAFPDAFHGFGHGCAPTYTKRYMYMPVPPTHNASTDIRTVPSYTPLPDVKRFGIFQHPDLEGNYTNQRKCPEFKGKSSVMKHYDAEMQPTWKQSPS
jgi:hypothetical protein